MAFPSYTPVLSSSYSGSSFHSGYAPYATAEPVMGVPVTLTPDEHAKTVTVECGGRAYTYDAAGRHIGTDVTVAPGPVLHSDDHAAQWTLADAGISPPLTASEILVRRAAIDAQQALQLALLKNHNLGGPGPLIAADPLAEPVAVPARSSAWHRGIATLRKWVPR